MGVYLGQTVYNESEVTPEWVNEEIAKNGKGVFFATYEQTTFQNILQEYNNGKIVVCKHEPVTPGEITAYYLNLVRFDTETFEFVGVMDDGTIYKTSINANEGWDNLTTIPPVVVDVALDSSSHNPVENMAIATELTAINNKITGDLNDIFLALASKGVTVPAGAGLDDVAGLITDIPAGGGVEPLPENWVRVTGLKGAWNHAGNPFKFPNLVDTTNENLESTSLVYIEPITAAPYASGNQQETQIFCPFASLYFQFLQRYGNNVLIVHGENGGGNRSSDFNYGSNTFGGMKTLTYKRNVLYMDGTTFVVDSRVYAQTTVRDLSGLWGKWSAYNENTPCTFFDCTVKDNDKVIAHFIPVKNTVTGEPRLYDEVSGTLSEEYGQTLLNDFEIIP